MEKRKDNELLLDLRSLGFLGNEKNKIKVRGKDVSIRRPQSFPGFVHKSQPTHFSISPERWK